MENCWKDVMKKIPGNNVNQNLLMIIYFLFKTLPMVISGISIYLGYRLYILGVTGKASLSIDTETVKGQLLNAAPGLFFAIGGIIALIIIVWKGVKLDFDDGKVRKLYDLGDFE